MPGTPPPPGAPDLTPAQREELRRLLHRELRDAYAAALADGATPEQLDAHLDERRRALRSGGAGRDPGSEPADDA